MSNAEPRPGEIWQFRIRGELTWTVGFVFGPRPDKLAWVRELNVDRQGNVIGFSQVMRKRYYVPDKLIGKWDIKPTVQQGIPKSQ